MSANQESKEVAAPKKTTVVISHNVASRDLVAELWSGENRLGEIFLDDDVPKLRLYAPPRNAWYFELDDFLLFLLQAKQELVQKNQNS